MSTSEADERIGMLHTTDDALVVTFVDGRTLSVPLALYPRLLNASPEQRSDWRLIGEGEGIHWSQIDEDLSAAGLLRGVPDPASKTTNEAGQNMQRIADESNLGSKFQLYKDRKGEYRWRLRASNGEIIADGNEGYSSKDSCLYAISLVRQQAASAVVETVAV